MPYILDPRRQAQLYLQEATRHPMHQRPDTRDRLFGLPTCLRCGAVAFRHRSPHNVVCPMCGYEGPPGPSLVQRWREIAVPGSDMSSDNSS